MTSPATPPRSTGEGGTALLVAKVAGAGLAGREGEHHPWAPDLLEFELLLETCARERLLGLLHYGATHGEVVLHQAQLNRLGQVMQRQLSHMAILDELLVETVRAFWLRKIDVRLLKGRAIADLDYTHSGSRHFTDVDLLVRSRDFDAAAALLSELGHARRGFPERSRGYEARFGKGTSFVSLQGLGIDLHRALALPPFGLSVVEADLFAGGEQVTVGSTPILSMGLEQRFLHVCIHAAVGDYIPRWLPLRDVLELGFAPDLNVEVVVAMARRWRITSIVVRAIRLACERIDGATRPEWARDLSDPLNAEWERHALALALEHAPPGIERFPATWFALQRNRDKVVLLLGTALPSRTFLAGRYDGYLDYWQRQWHRIKT